MLRLSPILIALLFGFGIYWFSAFRLRKTLSAQSVELVDPNLQPVIQKLAGALDVDKIKVHRYEIDTVNGLAAPDGRIFITRGLYNKYRVGEITAQELATVIAHELGHIALGHSRRRMIDFSSQNAVRAALSMVLSRFIPWVGPWIANMLVNMLAAKLSRSDEYEADEYASALLVKAGIGLGPQISLFAKLENLTGQMGSAPAWLLSHPKTEERIAAIEKRQNDWGQ